MTSGFRAPPDELTAQLQERKIRSRYFEAELTFIKSLTDISSYIRNLHLKDKPSKNMNLQNQLQQLNNHMDSYWGVYIPILAPDGKLGPPLSIECSHLLSSVVKDS